MKEIYVYIKKSFMVYNHLGLLCFRNRNFHTAVDLSREYYNVSKYHVCIELTEPPIYYIIIS